MEEKYNELGKLLTAKTDLVLKHQTESAAASQENEEFKKVIAQMAKKLKEKGVKRLSEQF